MQELGLWTTEWIVRPAAPRSTGIIPLDNTSDVVGPVTRSVEDAARMFGALAGYDARDPLTRLALNASLPANYTQFLDAGGLKVLRARPRAPRLTVIWGVVAQCGCVGHRWASASNARRPAYPNFIRLCDHVRDRESASRMNCAVIPFGACPSARPRRLRRMCLPAACSPLCSAVHDRRGAPPRRAPGSASCGR